MEIMFSAGKIRSDFRSGKCLGGKFLPGWKGSPDLPGDWAELGREKEQQRFEPSSKRGSQGRAAPSPPPQGLQETRIAPEQQIARGKSRMGRGR